MNEELRSLARVKVRSSLSMPISSGTRLGPYEVIAPLGAGGMGEVYRARDTRLDRTVAVKILPAHLSSDSTLRLRFMPGESPSNQQSCARCGGPMWYADTCGIKQVYERMCGFQQQHGES